MKKIVYLIFLALILSSCMKEQGVRSNDTALMKNLIIQNFNNINTKEKVSIDIRDLNLFIYLDGKLDKKIYRKASELLGDKVLFDALPNKSYNIYLIANVGDIRDKAVLKEEELKQWNLSCDYSIMLKDKIYPLVGYYKDWSLNKAYRFKLEALCAIYSFNIKEEDRQRYKIKSLSLCNVVRNLRPFGELDDIEGSFSSKCQSENELLPEDSYKLSQEDIDRINSGEKLYFPILENMQGTLKPEEIEVAKIKGKNLSCLSGNKQNIVTYIKYEVSDKQNMLLKKYTYLLGDRTFEDISVKRRRCKIEILDFNDKGAEIEYEDDFILKSPTYIGNFGMTLVYLLPTDIKKFLYMGLSILPVRKQYYNELERYLSNNPWFSIKKLERSASVLYSPIYMKDRPSYDRDSSIREILKVLGDTYYLLNTEGRRKLEEYLCFDSNYTQTCYDKNIYFWSYGSTRNNEVLNTNNIFNKIYEDFLPVFLPEWGREYEVLFVTYPIYLLDEQEIEKLLNSKAGIFDFNYLSSVSKDKIVNSELIRKEILKQYRKYKEDKGI